MVVFVLSGNRTSPLPSSQVCGLPKRARGDEARGGRPAAARRSATCSDDDPLPGNRDGDSKGRQQRRMVVRTTEVRIQYLATQTMAARGLGGATLRATMTMGTLLSDYAVVGGLSILYSTVSDCVGSDSGGGRNKRNLSQTINAVIK